MRLVPLLLLALTLVPTAAAVDTLASFAEPRRGSDEVFEFVVTSEESGRATAVLFLNPVSSLFEILVYAGNGTELFHHRGGRGIQTLRALEPGEYRFFIRGTGTFAATQHHLAKVSERTDLVLDVERTLAGTHGYVLSPLAPYDVRFEGNVSVRWMDLTKADIVGSAERFSAPGNRTAVTGRPAYVLVGGAAGTPYEIHLNQTTLPAASTPTPSPAQTPGPGGVLVALLAALAGVACRRRMRAKP